MFDMTGWDVAILLVAAYCAVVTLVRLMRTRRDAVLAQLHSEVAAQRERQRAAKRREASRSGRANSALRVVRDTQQ